MIGIVLGAALTLGLYLLPLVLQNTLHHTSFQPGVTWGIPTTKELAAGYLVELLGAAALLIYLRRHSRGPAYVHAFFVSVAFTVLGGMSLCNAFSIWPLFRY